MKKDDIFTRHTNGEFDDYKWGVDLYKSPNGYDHSPTLEVLTSDGYMIPITPSYDINTQILTGQKVFNDPDIEWEIRDLSPEEISQNLINKKLKYQHNLNFGYEQTMSQMVEGYSEFERDTFDKQEEEARKWLLDNNADTPLLDNIAFSREITVSELVPLVIANADLFILNAGLATGHRQKLRDLIDNATNVQEVETYTW